VNLSDLSEMDPKEIGPALAQTMRVACNNSLYLTAKYLLGFKDINWKTHGEVLDVLESEGQRKLICMPRGCLKSSLACVAYPIWRLNRDSNLRILIDSELYTNSKNFLREIKAHLTSTLMTTIYGQYRSDLWNEAEITINQRSKSAPQASITAGGVETQKTGQHFDLIIADDLNSTSNTNSPENAQKVVDHYRYNISILDPRGTYVVIGTRYAANDVIGHILTNEEHDYKESA